MQLFDSKPVIRSSSPPSCRFRPVVQYFMPLERFGYEFCQTRGIVRWDDIFDHWKLVLGECEYIRDRWRDYCC
jgi:hypothetical protein